MLDFFQRKLSLTRSTVTFEFRWRLSTVAQRVIEALKAIMRAPPDNIQEMQTLQPTVLKLLI